MSRSNRTFVLRPCSAHAASTTETFDISADGRKALVLRIKTTTASGFSQTVTVSGVDEANSDLNTLLASAAITTASTVILNVGRGLPVTANVSANAVLPRKIRVSVTHTDATSVNYSITGELAD